MSDLIDRQAAIDAVIKTFEAQYGGSVLRDRKIRARFDALPTVENGRMVTAMTSEITTNGGTPITKYGYASPYQTVVGNIDDSLEKKISEMLKRLAPPEYTEVRCRECGGAIDQKWDDHIIKCPYCKTVYVVGRKMTNG